MMMPQHNLDDTYNPLRMFESSNKRSSAPANDGTTSTSSGRDMAFNQPINATVSLLQITNIHTIPFDPEQLIQDCDDFSVSSCEAQTFLDDDFEFVSNNSDAFWEQGVITASTLERKESVANVSLSSEDKGSNLQSSDSMDFS